MAHSFSRNHLHVIFSTRERRKTIPREWQPRLWAYLAGICNNHGMIALAVGGTQDHVHLLFHLPPRLALAKAGLLLKSNSSKWMGEQGREFSWQARLRRFQREFLEPQRGNAIRTESGGASSQDRF